MGRVPAFDYRTNEYADMLKRSARKPDWLMGVWQIEAPEGACFIEFTPEGLVQIYYKVYGKELTLQRGRYVIEKNNGDITNVKMFTMGLGMSSMPYFAYGRIRNDGDKAFVIGSDMPPGFTDDAVPMLGLYNYPVQIPGYQDEAIEMHRVLPSEIPYVGLPEDATYTNNVTNTNGSDEEIGPEPNKSLGFYGIWVMATKDIDEAIDMVKKVNDAGFTGQVYDTANWSNLSSESWYVVCAGRYGTKAAANDALAKVQQAGFADAYVKYTGGYLEE